MGFWKFAPFLALGFLVLYQVGFLQAAPIRAAMESPQHPASLNEEEVDHLLAALIKNILKKNSEPVQETEGSSITAQKRACNTGTCLTHKLAGLLSKTGSVANSNLLPPDMVSKNSGRKVRDLDA